MEVIACFCKLMIRHISMLNNVDLYGAKGSASSVTKVYSKAGYSPDKRTDAKLVANG